VKFHGITRTLGGVLMVVLVYAGDVGPVEKEVRVLPGRTT
jgi:hypothetical protein